MTVSFVVILIIACVMALLAKRLKLPYTVMLVAAGLVALSSAGIYEGPEVERGLVFLSRFVATPENVSRISDHFLYGHYYAVQAAWQAGGETWSKWYPAIRDHLVAIQQAGGGWRNRTCDHYGTAMALLILQAPNNYLPIFHR